MVLADRPFGEWNSFRIIQAKDYAVFLNDQLVVDHAKMENFWDRSNLSGTRDRFNSKPMAEKSFGATFSSGKS